MGWWDHIEETESVEHKAERLARVLAKKPGTHQEKLAWLIQNVGLMESELEREGIDPADSRRFGGGMKSLTLRWWRNHQKTAPRVPVFEEKREPDVPLTEGEKAEVRASIDELRERKPEMRRVK